MVNFNPAIPKVSCAASSYFDSHNNKFASMADKAPTSATAMLNGASAQAGRTPEEIAKEYDLLPKLLPQFAAKRQEVLDQLEKYEQESAKITDLLSREDVITNLRSDKVANLEYLKKEHEVCSKGG
jgi:hypothetical protein